MTEIIFPALLGGALLLMIVMFVLYRRKREKQLEEIVMYLMRIQDGAGLPEWKSYGEGQVGILQSEIYKLIRQLADNGVGVIVVSSEMPELLGLCDRIAVMAEGRITAFFDIADATEEKLAKAATGDIA